MNLRTATIAYRAASTLYGRYRSLNDEQKRNVYEAVRDMARAGGDPKNPDELAKAVVEGEGRLNKKQAAARREAGDLTRAAHDRLDRQRALFEATINEKKAKKQAEKQAKRAKTAKQAKAGGISAGVLALLAAIAGGVWYFFFREDNQPKQQPRKDHKPVVKTGEKKRDDGSVTRTYSTTTDPEPAAKTTDHGPLSEEPADRDEALLSSIDEQLSTLDALDDDQRNATEPRH